MWIIHQTYGFDSLIEPEVSRKIAEEGLTGVAAISLYDHQLLAAIFGGILYGIGLGMIFRSRATSGGSDIISMIINKYLHISMGTAVTIVDGLITLSTVIAFGDWKLPMYSWLIIIIESIIIDKVIEGQAAKTMMIISTRQDEIRKVKAALLCLAFNRDKSSFGDVFRLARCEAFLKLLPEGDWFLRDFHRLIGSMSVEDDLPMIGDMILDGHLMMPIREQALLSFHFLLLEEVVPYRRIPPSAGARPAA